MSEAITLRSHLAGSLNDLIESAKLNALGKCSIVCELVSLLADYQEEGASLFLDVFLTEELGNLIATIPQSASLLLGTTSLDEKGIKEAVKKTAPLVRGCWKMYLSPNAKKLDFGLFRDSGHPLNVPIDLILKPGPDVNSKHIPKFIRVTKLAEDVVRVAVHNGKQIVVHFTNSDGATTHTGDSTANISELICSTIDAKISQSSITYISSLLSKAIRGSHGSLIAVSSSKKLPAFLKSDCTMLVPPINICDVVESVRRDSNSIPQLEALEGLVCGMFCSDGVVVFNTDSEILAYNAFVKLKASNIVGGARKRAYQALCDRVGKELVAAFFQSQDGASDLKK